MKFTLAWLKDHLDTTATLAQIADKLTAIGLEVEQVNDPATALKDFIVAEIKEAVQHPNADKLRVCQVNDGSGVRQVVCGAPNARAGIKVVLAREGVKVPESGMVIKKTAIRGVESNGMLCSAHELNISEDSEGIIELPASAVVGEPVAKSLGLDPVIEIAITPNRADCLGVYGVARDLAAAGLGTLKPLKPATNTYKFKSPVTVTLETPACPMFIGCAIKGVKNGPSPEWLQQHLKSIGLRPISTLVDITNYITFDLGRPLHVFDMKKFKGNIRVHYAKAGEKLQALNDKEYTLAPDMVAVSDDSGVISLGGIIGGTSTGCDTETVDVFLEAALWDPASIAATGRMLSVESDARYRFERGVDPEFVKTGAEIAVRMLLELCGGEASELVIAGKAPEWKREIQFDPKKVATLGGITVPADKTTSILSALGFATKGASVMPPSWRADIDGSADLVEEVLRISGYDAIPSTPLPALPKKVKTEPAQQRIALMRRTLATHGMTEICSWAFVSDAQAKQFGGDNPALTLLNPISSDLDTMRPSLLPGLLAALKNNGARGFSSLALFETGNVYKDVTPQGHILMTSGIRSGDTAPRNHLSSARSVDLFDAKADLFALLEAAGLNPAKLHIDRNVPAWYHPSRSGRISLGGKITLGYFGDIHPLILSAFDVKTSVAAFEAFVDAIPLPRSKGKAKPSLVVSNFQAVERDFAFVAGERVLAADIVKAIESTDKQLIQCVNVFDVYTGKGVETGKKSLAISVTLQAADRTLSDKEITDIAQKIIAAATGLGLTLRA